MALQLCFTLAIAVLVQHPAREVTELSLPGATPAGGTAAPDTQPVGAPVVVPHVVEHGGRLRAWVESRELDTSLRIETEEGRLLAADDDSGGGKTPLVDLAVDAGAKLHLVVDGKQGAGRVRLIVAEMPETEATKALAQEALAGLQAAQALVAAGQPEDGGARARSELERVLAAPALDESDALQSALSECARILYGMGDTASAGRALERLVPIHEQLMPPASPTLNRLRLYQSSILGIQGDTQGSLALARRTLETLLAWVAPEDDLVLEARFTIGESLSRTGDPEGASAQFESVLAVWSRTHPPDDHALMDLRTFESSVLFQLGRLDEARATCERALDTASRILKPDSLNLMRMRQMLAAIVEEQGDYPRNLVLLEQALEVAKRCLPADHPDLAFAKYVLAVAARLGGDPERARVLIEEALPVYEKALGHDDPRVHRLRNEQGIQLLETGHVQEVVAPMRQLLADAERIQGADSGGAQSVRECLAVALSLLGHAAEACELQRVNVARSDRVLPLDHPARLHAHARMASLATSAELWEEAHAESSTASAGLVRYLAALALGLSSREAEAVVMRYYGVISVPIAIDGMPEQARFVDASGPQDLALIETARSIGVNALRYTRLARAHGEGVDEVLAKLRQRGLAVARAVRSGADGSTIAQAVAEREKVERDLRARIGTAGRDAPLAPTELVKSIADRLGEDEVAVGFWIYAPISPRESLRQDGPDSLLALVVRRDQSIVRVELGPLEELQKIATAWLTAIEDPHASPSAVREAGETARKRLVDPVRARVPDAKRWLAALDLPLNRIPVDALPDGDGSGAVLGDHLQITLCTSLADREKALPAREPALHSLVALGAVDFDLEPHSEPVVAGLERGARDDRSNAVFAALPGSAQEIESVADLFSRTHGESASTHVLLGAEASREALLAEAESARFLHVATHGFVRAGDLKLDASIGELIEGVPGASLSHVDSSARRLVPLVRCGLALAGANKIGDRAEIDAEEIGVLDLSGCEMAVLSACDTNRGLANAGQGIASFQKALHAAGVRTVVTSLWRVSDSATRDLMNGFYHGVWVEKLSKSEALWRAKKVLRDRRAPLRDWAGWVLSGDPS